ncbi:hypothetical protein MKX08_008764 [Trichoderma sp. CBMAI-0020]|nr:hypothetical protein MKX08_008764 [Trichoderma sp. CBMAI-0020]
MANIDLLRSKSSVGVASAYAYQPDCQMTVSICLAALALMYASEIDARIGDYPVTLLQIIHGSYEHGAVDDLAP